MSAPIRWWCSGCNEALSLSNTLWKSADGDYRCRAGGYPATGGGVVTHVERVTHRPANNWVHPALMEEGNAESAA